jgi:putative peptidoglycan lipid II flippase
MSTRRRLVTATGGMAVVTMVSRLSGLAREKVVSALLGAGTVTDAFVTGLRVPNMFRAFLAEGSLHASFIPVLAEIRERGESGRERAFVRAMTSLLLLALPVVIGLGVLGAPLLVDLFAAPFRAEPAKFALAVKLTRLMFPYLGLISLAALAQGVLNAHDRFLLAAATPIALNLCVVAGTVTAVSFAGVRPEWLAVGVLTGGLAQLAMQWPACRRIGLPLFPGTGALSNPDVRRVLQLMLPGLPALGVYQLSLLLSNRFASSVGSGAVTCVYQASRVNELVYGVAIVQLTTVVLPMLSAELARDATAARGTVAFATRVLTAVALPSAAFTAAAAVPIVGALLGGGRYTDEMVRTTAAALLLYAAGLPFLGLVRLQAGVSFAWKDTRTPLFAAIANLAVFFAAGSTLTAPFGAAGVAAAASLGQAVNAGLLLALNTRAGRLPPAASVLPSVARHAAAAALVLVAVRAAVWALPAPLVTGARSLAVLGLYAVVGGAVYLAALTALRATELSEAWSFVRRRKAP